MFLKKIVKAAKDTGKTYEYYRLCESYRIGDKVRHRNILNVGKLNNLNETERKLVADRIEEMLKGSGSLFTRIISQKVESYARNFYCRLKNKKLISAGVQKSSANKLFEEEHDWEEVNLASIKDEDCRETGAEWLCKQAIDKLGIKKFLLKKKWKDKWITRAMISLISRQSLSCF